MFNLFSTKFSPFGILFHRRALQFACVAACFLLTACGASSAVRADRPTQITYWRTLSGAAGNAQDQLVKKFNASQNAIQVTADYQGGYSDLGKKLLTAAAAHTGPDVTQLGTYEIREFVQSGVLVNLRPFLDGPNGIATKNWPGTIRRAGQINGGIYWLPFNVAVPILYYNANAFKAAGLTGPPKTWGDFFYDARALTLRDQPDKVRRAGVALWTDIWPYLSAIWSNGGQLTSKDYASITLNDPVAVRVLTNFQDLVRDGAAIVPDATSGGDRAAFESGRAAMILDSPAALADIFKLSVGFKPKIASYPAGTAGKVFAPGGGGLAMLASTPKAKRQAAWSFIKFLLAPQQLAYFAKESGYAAFTAAARKAAGNQLASPRFVVIEQALPHLRGDFSVTMEPAIREPFAQAVQKILIDLADVQTTLDQANQTAITRMQERQKPS